jgi:hypothetical protein
MITALRKFDTGKLDILGTIYTISFAEVINKLDLS